MIPEITFSNKLFSEITTIFLIHKDSNISLFNLSKTESKFLKDSLKKDKKNIDINSYSYRNYFRVIDDKKLPWQVLEEIRKIASKTISSFEDLDDSEIQLFSTFSNEDYLLALAEGLILSNYKFDKYFTLGDSQIFQCTFKFRLLNIQSWFSVIMGKYWT